MGDLSVFQEKTIITVMNTMNAHEKFQETYSTNSTAAKKNKKEMNLRRPILDLQVESIQQELTVIYFTLQ